jgi:hypothetical protein
VETALAVVITGAFPVSFFLPPSRTDRVFDYRIRRPCWDYRVRSLREAAPVQEGWGCFVVRLDGTSSLIPRPAAVKEPSSSHEVEITQHCQVRVDASTGGVMSKRTFDTATEDLMAYNNRMQDDAFCQALRAALSAGKESCAPGTEKPILNYQRSD